MSEIAQAFVRIRPEMGSFQSETESGIKSGFSHVARIVGEAFAGVEALKFGNEVVQGAAQVQKSVETIQQQFGAAGQDIVDFNENAAKTFGISAAAGDAAAAKFGLLFKNIGVGTSTAAEMTTGWEKLAGSIAQIKGVDPSTILDKLPLAAAGNTRALKQMGIVVDTTSEKLAAYKLGLISSVKDALTPAEKAEAIYAIAVQHSGQFQQEAAAHAGDLANQQIKLSAEWSNAKDTIGEKLLPVMSTLVGFMANNLPAAMSAVGTVTHDTTAFMQSEWAQHGAAIEAGARTAWGATQQVVSTATAAIQQYWTEHGAAIEADVRQVWADIQVIFQAATAAVTAIWNQFGGAITSIAKTQLQEAYTIIKTVLQSVVDVFDIISAVLQGHWSAAWQKIKELVSTILSGVWQVIKDEASIAATIMESLGSLMLKGLLAGLEALPAATWALIKAAIESYSQFASWIDGEMEKIGADIVKGIAKGIEASADEVVSAAASLVDKIPKTLRHLLDIGSPSKVMADQVGAPMALGLPAGWDSVSDSPAGLKAHATKTVKDATAATLTSLETSFASLKAKAAELGTGLTATMEDKLKALGAVVSNAVKPTDVANARASIQKLGKEVSGDLSTLKQQISLTHTFQGIEDQVKKLGDDEPPAVAAAMKRITDEIGDVTTQTTPQQIAKIKTAMTNVRSEISTELSKIKTAISEKQSVFSGAFSSLLSAADTDFQRETQKVLANMQVAVAGINGQSGFQFGGSITETPAQQQLDALQAAHDAAALQTQLQNDQAQQAADAAAGTADLQKTDAAAVADDLYNIQVAALQKQAAAEQLAASKQLQTAQNDYQTQRDALQQQMDQRLTIIETGLTNGTLSAKAGMDQITAVFADPSYGVTINQAAFALGGNLYQGLNQGLAPVFGLLQSLIDLQAKAGLVPQSAASSAAAAAAAAGKVGTASSSGASALLGLNPQTLKNITDPIVGAIAAQTEAAAGKDSTVTVVVKSGSGGGNQSARDALR